MTPQEAHDKGVENFKSGMTCSQSVSSIFAERFGFDPDVINDISLPFGAGMCRLREVCGTYSGMLMALGMYQSHKYKNAANKPDQKSLKDETYAIGQELARRFIERNGSLICRELLGLVPMGTSQKLAEEKKADEHKADSPVSEERTKEYYEKRPCPEKCGIAAEIFQQWLDEQQ